MIRRALLALAAMLAAALLASCGKGGPTGSGAAAGSSRPRSGASQPGAAGAAKGAPVTYATARAYARAVNLIASDVPGFTASELHEHNTARERRLEHELMSCAGLTGTSKGVLEEGSKSFELKHGIVNLSVSSEVSVEPSAAQARRLRGAVASPRVRGCFSRYLELLLRSLHVKGASIGAVTIQSGTPPAPGTGGGFGWRITASFGVRGVKLPFYLDILGFVEGPSEVTLTSSGLLRPFPAEAQQRLYTLLLTRAKAHAL
ncbi:MAG TPA: hypothetical protein VGX69_01650 [Solirubrobacteraceae bacterium]|jgi:hypothetical protein|nr:hypothetical protein [Solirubrobacteraceae bacterium]